MTLSQAEAALESRARELGLTVAGYEHPADYTSLYNLWMSLGLIRRPKGNQEEDLKRIAEVNGPSLLLVLKDKNGEVQACCFGLFNGYGAVLHHVATAVPYGGQGLGGLLIDVLHERVQARGAVYIDLIVRVGNPAIGLYARKGYAIELDGSNCGTDKISMIKFF